MRAEGKDTLQGFGEEACVIGRFHPHLTQRRTGGGVDPRHAARCGPRQRLRLLEAETLESGIHYGQPQIVAGRVPVRMPAAPAAGRTAKANGQPV